MVNSEVDYGLWIVFAISSIGFFILITRFLGAWMLRINDIIKLQKEILNELKKLNNLKGS